MLARGHTAHADCQGKPISSHLHRLAWILGCNDSRQREGFCCVPRRQRAVQFVRTRSVWPESSLAVSFIGPFAIGGELQCCDYEHGIDDRFRPETPCFGEVLIVSSQTEEVEPSSTSQSGVGRTEAGDNIACVYPALVGAKVLLCLRVVVERNSGASGKRHEPDGISRSNTQRTRPDAGLIVANVFETLAQVRHSANYGLRGWWLLLVFRGLIR